MKWITRERPKIDRIACPWLIKKFVDKDAEFIYVPFNEVTAKAIAAGATALSPVQDYEYGYRQGTIRDPFGHHWCLERMDDFYKMPTMHEEQKA